MCEEIVKNQMAIVTIKPTPQHIGYVVGVGRVGNHRTSIGDMVVRVTMDDEMAETMEKLLKEFKIIKENEARR